MMLLISRMTGLPNKLLPLIKTPQGMNFQGTLLSATLHHMSSFGSTLMNQSVMQLRYILLYVKITLTGEFSSLQFLRFCTAGLITIRMLQRSPLLPFFLVLTFPYPQLLSDLLQKILDRKSFLLRQCQNTQFSDEFRGSFQV